MCFYRGAGGFWLSGAGPCRLAPNRVPDTAPADAEEEFARESVDKGVSCVLTESADDLLTAPLAGVGLEVEVTVDVDVADADVDASVFTEY